MVEDSAEPTTTMLEPPDEEDKLSSSGATRRRGTGADGGECEDACGGENTRECGERRRR
jgi:hypothetical protein